MRIRVLRTFSPLCTLREFFLKNGRSTVFISGVVVDDRSFVRLPYSNGTIALAFRSIIPLCLQSSFLNFFLGLPGSRFSINCLLLGGEGRCTNVNCGVFTANVNIDCCVFFGGCQKWLHFPLYSHRTLHVYDLFTSI